MSIYQGLARIYDQLVEDVDYKEWAQYIKLLTEKYGEEINSVLDIACGTGNTSVLLAQIGWRVTGVDISLPMLQQARNKAGEAKMDIIFLQQDIRNLELTREFDLVTCFQDGLNYLISEKELEQAFQSIYKRLVPRGLFIFDLDFNEKYSTEEQGDTIFIDKEDFSLIYQVKYLSHDKVWEIDITGFVKEDQKYTKFREIHQERLHHLENVTQFLSSTGFRVLDVFEAFSLTPFHTNSSGSSRVFVIAQKNEGRE